VVGNAEEMFPAFLAAVEPPPSGERASAAVNGRPAEALS